MTEFNSVSNGDVMTAFTRPLVLCGPSGCGKSTLVRKLFDEFEQFFGFSISHTTRKPRSGELNGREYHFIEREEFEESIKNGSFVEYTQFANNFYGTSKKAIEAVQITGKICVLDLEIEGVKNLKKTDLNPICIFVAPPDLQSLEKRLRDRGTESEDMITRRLARARRDMADESLKHLFDLYLINDNIDAAYEEMKKFILKKLKLGKN